MNYREFRSLVTSMRAAQKEYFRSRDSAALENSKRLEREVDKELRDVGQAKMFDDNKKEPAE